MLKVLSRIWDRWEMPAAMIGVGASLTLAAGALLATPSYPTGQDCASRLSNPATMSAAERQWLETCVSALTLPTTTPSGTSPPSTTTPAPTPPPSTTQPPTPAPGFPTPQATGVPAGWVPVSVRSTDLRVTQSGAVIQDIRFNGGNLIVDAPNVTVRRVEFLCGRINNVPGSVCRNGLVIEDTSFGFPAGPVTTRATDPPAIQHGGYTARRVKINGYPEGFRVGGKGAFACGPVTIEDSFARIVAPSPTCGDWHGDGIQGYDGPALTARNNTLELVERSGCGGTAPFFYPRNQGNTSITVDRLLVMGGGYSFRNGMPGTVRGLRIMERAGWYGPIDVRCSVMSVWEAQIVRVSGYVPTFVRTAPCNTESGF
jgi:hypothetical protein